MPKEKVLVTKERWALVMNGQIINTSICPFDLLTMRNELALGARMQGIDRKFELRLLRDSDNIPVSQQDIDLFKICQALGQVVSLEDMIASLRERGETVEI